MKAENPNIEVVSPKEFQTKLAEDPNSYLLDVRTPEEYETGHLRGAHSIDWFDANFKQQADKIDKSKTIYVYCRSGKRSYEAARYLTSKGYKVVDMDGGILAWQRAALPTTTASTD